jgi:xanthine dehydrogenase small subunit
MNGNICRCTGYKSIERAAQQITKLLQHRKNEDAIAFAVNNHIIPTYFKTIKERLQLLNSDREKIALQVAHKKILGGGTDLYVQEHDSIADEDMHFLFDHHSLNGITQLADICSMGASVTVADIAKSPIFKNHFIGLEHYIKLVSSTQIRNMATIAGNICNASPIGDFSIFFLALDAQLQLGDGSSQRTVPLRQFYKGHKLIDKSKEEFIEKITFRLPANGSFFHFEKVCKRTHLDIATVNTAICLAFKEDTIESAGLAAGGVAPVPLYLGKSSMFLAGKKITPLVVQELLAIIETEISPISDVRGSAAYKKLLLQQLVKAHFLKLVPGIDL